jgi:hypothetical protein
MPIIASQCPLAASVWRLINGTLLTGTLTNVPVCLGSVGFGS